jgi:hypothetical protein
MNFSDSAWQELVASYASSLTNLQEAASAIAPLSIEELEAPGEGGSVVESAQIHLQNSLRIEEYVSQRLPDPDAIQVLGRVASVDFEVAGLLDDASEEPEVAIDAFRQSTAALDVKSIRADLLGLGAIRGGQTNPEAFDAVHKDCDDVLANAAKRAKDLAADLTVAVELADVLDGLAGIVGGTVANWIEELKKDVGVVKQKVLDFVNRGLAKLAKLLGLDLERIQDELTDFWDKLKGKIGNWVANVLGRSEALEAWRNWLAEQPAPDNARVAASLKIVDKSKEDHNNQLKWAGKAIWVYGKLAKWGATFTPAGPPVVAAVAVGLGGWVTWTTWDFLQEVKASAA